MQNIYDRLFPEDDDICHTKTDVVNLLTRPPHCMNDLMSRITHTIGVICRGGFTPGTSLSLKCLSSENFDKIKGT